MQEHPIPRQITTFEFKLIGELTIKQFGFLAFASVIAVVLFFIVPRVVFLNFIAAAVPALIGVGFAFVPINERPMDIWVKNLIKRLTSPTQYYYQKHNAPPKILLGITLPPREIAQQHLLAQQKLREYLQTKPKTTPQDTTAELDQETERKKQAVRQLLDSTRQYNTGGRTQQTPTASFSTPPPPSPPPRVVSQPTQQTPSTSSQQPATQPSSTLNLKGHIYSPNGVPLEGVLVYVKKNDEVVRLFKTDSSGAFVNNLPLPQGEYLLSFDDPKKKYTFDRMNIKESSESIQVFAQRIS